MDLQERIVAKIPLEEIWNQSEIISKERLKYITDEDVRNLLKQDKVQFVVANVGFPLDWVSVDEHLDFFKSELKNRIADNEENYLENFSGNYFYYASVWNSDSLISIVLLEMYH